MNMQCILDARNNFYISYFESHKKSLKQLHIIVPGNLNKSAKQPMKIVVANACRIQCKQGSNVAQTTNVFLSLQTRY
jgi:hypothetical protein